MSDQPPESEDVRASQSALRAQVKPRPLSSLVASAQRLTSRSITRAGSNAKSWQEDAWEMYDLVGEQRFLASTLAGRLAQARFYVGEVTDDQTEEPKPTENEEIAGILEAVGSSEAAKAQLVQRLGVNLFVAGDGWLAGIPKSMFPPHMMPSQSMELTEPGPSTGPLPSRTPVASPTPVVVPIQQRSPEPDEGTEDLEWRMFSVSEVSSNAGGEVTLNLSETDKITCSPDAIFLVRVWRPHPRKWWEADSPTRSSLPVLREIVGLTMHISAQVDSRLAGAGMLLVPQSAQRALKAASGTDENDDTDEFTEALMEAMIKPISDRANASALVPLVITVPDEATKLFEYITFAKPLDAEARTLREEAIRRLALGQDAPPELLLGMSGMNHWGAWLVREDVVTTHLEPPLALIADALTTQYLWPVLQDQGMSEEQAQGYVVWYDVSHMIMRPNRSTDALTLHERGAINDETLRESAGFGDSDAPKSARIEDALKPESKMALDLARANPSLFVDPGLPALIAQLREVIADDIPASSPPVPSPEGEGVPADQLPLPPGTPTPTPTSEVPATSEAPAPSIAASSLTEVMGDLHVAPDGSTFLNAPNAANGLHAQTFAMERRVISQNPVFRQGRVTADPALIEAHHTECNEHCHDGVHYLLDGHWAEGPT